MDNLKNYPGNKNFAIAYQNIINLIPPHKTYYEIFAGSAGVYRHKRLAQLSILNDLNPEVCSLLSIEYSSRSSIDITNSTSVELLSSIGSGSVDNFIYMDPPYLHSTRPNSTQLYGKFEMSESDHIQLLSSIAAAIVKSNCMISHYPCELYDTYLKNWNTKDFKVCYHGRVKVERLYYNYKSPIVIHDYTHLGKNFTDRQRIKRKVKRFITKLDALPKLERNKIIQEINQKFN